MPHSVIYSLETESWKWHGIGLVASEAPAKQVWYAETYSFDTTLATMFCTNCNLCNWYLSKPYNSALQKSSLLPVGVLKYNTHRCNQFLKRWHKIHNFSDQHRLSLFHSSGGDTSQQSECQWKKTVLVTWPSACVGCAPLSQPGNCWSVGEHEVGILVPAAPSKRCKPFGPLSQTVFCLL